MQDKETLRKELQKVIDIAFTSATHVLDKHDIKTENDLLNISEDDRQNIRNEFISQCHKGYKLAQNMIIEKLKLNQKKIRQLKNNIKSLNRENKRKEARKFKKEVNILKYINKVFSHIADRIALSLFLEQDCNLRRLDIGDRSDKYLDSSNIESVISVAQKINENPLDFALLADITNVVQVGDLIIIENGTLSLAEVKEGKINDELLDVLYSSDPMKQITNIKDSKKVKQLQRMINQKERMEKVEQIINTGHGIDLKTGFEIRLSQTEYVFETYCELINTMYKELETKDWSYNLVENCVIVGMYQKSFYQLGYDLFCRLVKQKTNNSTIINFITIVDSSAYNILNSFLHPTLVAKLMSTEINLFIAVDHDVFIKMLKSEGLNIKLLSKKETTDISQNLKDTPITINRQAVAYSSKNGDKVLFSGALAKIVYNLYPPSLVAKMHANEYKKNNN